MKAVGKFIPIWDNINPDTGTFRYHYLLDVKHLMKYIDGILKQAYNVD